MIIMTETVSANTNEASMAQSSAPIRPANDWRAASRAVTTRGVTMAKTRDGIESLAEMSGMSP